MGRLRRMHRSVHGLAVVICAFVLVGCVNAIMRKGPVVVDGSNGRGGVPTLEGWTLYFKTSLIARRSIRAMVSVPLYIRAHK